jgi:hypothetical protein
MLFILKKLSRPRRTGELSAATAWLDAYYGISSLSALKTATAVNRTVTGGVKRYFCFYSATGAGDSVHPPLGPGAAVATLLAGCAAGGATNRVVFKTLFRVKRLLAGSENKVLLAVAAGQGFVYIAHSSDLLC